MKIYKAVITVMSDETIHANKTEFGAGLSERLLGFAGNSTFAKMELEEYDENPIMSETEEFIQAECGHEACCDEEG